jgi:hypothetical protein
MMLMMMMMRREPESQPCDSRTQDSVYIALPSYQHRDVGGGGYRLSTRHIYSRWSQLSFSSQLDLHTAERGLQKLYNYVMIGEDK